MVISKRARQFYKDGLIALGICACPTAERVKAHISFYAPDRRKRDLDNHVKAVFDLMTKAQVWVDDSQVDYFSVSRETIMPKGKFVIEIWQLKKEKAG